MIKKHVVMITSFSAIFGIIMGVSVVSLAWMQSTANFPKLGTVAKTETGIVTKVELLEKLRSGHYNDAATQLEAWLDNDLIGAGELAREGAELNVSTLQAMETERKARGVSGYEPANASVNAAVQEAFRLVPHADVRATPIMLRGDKY